MDIEEVETADLGKLRQWCTERGLPMTGSASVLRNRLRASCSGATPRKEEIRQSGTPTREPAPTRQETVSARGAGAATPRHGYQDHQEPPRETRRGYRIVASNVFADNSFLSGKGAPASKTTPHATPTKAAPKVDYIENHHSSLSSHSSTEEPEFLVIPRLEAFSDMQKIDCQFYLFQHGAALLEQAGTDNFSKILIVNSDLLSELGTLAEQQEQALSLMQYFPDKIAWAASFSMEGFPSAAWKSRALDTIKAARQKGACAINMGKSIGMGVVVDGHHVMCDNEAFADIYNYIEQLHIPLVLSAGEPKNCWLPIDDMTVSRDSEHFAARPGQHRYQHPNQPTYEETLLARDRVLDRHPGLSVLCSDLAGLEWSVDVLARWLEKYPNAVVDFGDRIVHLQRQAQGDAGRVRDFLEKYSTRLVYSTATRGLAGDDIPENDFMDETHNTWKKDWAWLAASGKVRSSDLGGEVSCMALEWRALKNIYFRTAARVFKI